MWFMRCDAQIEIANCDDGVTPVTARQISLAPYNTASSDIGSNSTLIKPIEFSVTVASTQQRLYFCTGKRSTDPPAPRSDSQFSPAPNFYPHQLPQPSSHALQLGGLCWTVEQHTSCLFSKLGPWRLGQGVGYTLLPLHFHSHAILLFTLIHLCNQQLG